VVDFLFAIIEHFSLVHTVETLVEVGVFTGGSLSANFRGKGYRPPTSFGVRKLD